jgi:hypothetical protein
MTVCLGTVSPGLSPEKLGGAVARPQAKQRYLPILGDAPEATLGPHKANPATAKPYSLPASSFHPDTLPLTR